MASVPTGLVYLVIHPQPGRRGRIVGATTTARPKSIKPQERGKTKPWALSHGRPVDPSPLVLTRPLRGL